MTRRTAYATMLTRDSYVPGVAALACALQNSAHPLLLLIDDSLLDQAKSLQNSWRGCGARIHITSIPRVKVPSKWVHTSGWQGQYATRFHEAARKLAVFSMVHYHRIVFVDADILLRRPPDELFDDSVLRGAPLAAARDDGYHEAKSDHDFNSGVLVLAPQQRLVERMMAGFEESTSSDGGDQGFLHSFFADQRVVRLPRLYNTLKRRELLPGGLGNLSQLVGLHFVGEDKPWAVSADPNSPLCVERREYAAAQRLWERHVGACARQACATRDAVKSLGALNGSVACKPRSQHSHAGRARQWQGLPIWSSAAAGLAPSPPTLQALPLMPAPSSLLPAIAAFAALVGLAFANASNRCATAGHRVGL